MRQPSCINRSLFLFFVLFSGLLSACDSGEAGQVVESPWELINEEINAGQIPFYSSLRATSDGTLFAIASNPDWDTFMVVRSEDDGATWLEAFNLSLNDPDYRHDEVLMEVSPDGSVFVSITPQGSFDAGIQGKSKLYRSLDKGDTWSELSDTPWQQSGFIASMATSDDGIVYIGSGGNPGVQAVYRSNNHGDTWTQTALKSDEGGAIYGYLATGAGGAVYAIANKQYLSSSLDYGTTCSPRTVPWNESIQPNGDQKLWASPWGYLYANAVAPGENVLRYSENDGASWMTYVEPKSPRDLRFTRDNRIIAAGGEGVIISEDKGRSWQNIVDGLPVNSTGEVLVDIAYLLITPQGYLFAITQRNYAGVPDGLYRTHIK